MTVFFVISGFCIHYPFRGANPFELFPYLARRYIRIGIPLIAAVALSGQFRVNLSFFQDSILWSLVAELIYYSLYPWIRILKERFGWNKIIAGAYLAAFAVIALLYPSAADYAPSGNAPELADLFAVLASGLPSGGSGFQRGDGARFRGGVAMAVAGVVFGLGLQRAAVPYSSGLSVDAQRLCDPGVFLAAHGNRGLSSPQAGSIP